MKKLIVTTLIALPLALTAHAQWIVYDPTMEHSSKNHGSGAEHRQIRRDGEQPGAADSESLTDQLNEFKHYEDLFGNPKRSLLATVSATGERPK